MSEKWRGWVGVGGRAKLVDWVTREEVAKFVSSLSIEKSINRPSKS